MMRNVSITTIDKCAVKFLPVENESMNLSRKLANFDTNDMDSSKITISN